MRGVGTPGGRALSALEQTGRPAGSLSNTQRSYRKEAERLLLWAVVERQKPLSSLSAEDGAAYRAFLSDPQPRERWCGARSRERWSPLWRPFEGPLSASAQQLSLRIVGNLFRFLQQQNYLRGNPFAGVKAGGAGRVAVDAGRVLTAEQWEYLVREVQGQPPSPMARRLELSLHLLRSTGLRLAEAVAATVDDLKWVEYPGRPGDATQVAGWMLRVVGKGARVREVPVPEAVVELLRRSLEERGLRSDPLCPSNAGSFILGRLQEGRAVQRATAARGDAAKAGITANALYAHLKRFFQGCSAALERAGDPHGADRFKRASTHWLRHTHATHALERGVPLDVVRQNLGHASVATTSVYLHADSKRQLAAMAGVWEPAERIAVRRPAAQPMNHQVGPGSSTTGSTKAPLT
jgi:site-specific recombinase XerD